MNLLVGEGPKCTTLRKECLSHYRSEYRSPLAPNPTPTLIHADAYHDDPRSDRGGKRRTACPAMT